MRNRLQKSISAEHPPISFETVAPWVGHNHTVHIKIIGVQTQAALIQVIKSSVADFIVFEIDPFACDESEFTYLDQVALRSGDKITVEYSNPDGLATVIETTLEST